MLYARLLYWNFFGCHGYFQTFIIMRWKLFVLIIFINKKKNFKDLFFFYENNLLDGIQMHQIKARLST